MKPFVLTSMERQSALWKRLLEHMKAQRDVLREKNDNDLNEAATARVRGRIAQLTELVALDTPAPGVDP
jgi:hypothetical protein